MSCNYADGLSDYEHKGVLGVPETFDSEESIELKSTTLAEWIKASKHVVVHTGAGISTSAGIPDFRGPNGVWTLEKQGKKPNMNISFNESIPTKTHMALKQLIESGYVHYIISQNIDGLHLRSGIDRKFIAELHGNMFINECNVCESKFIRNAAATTVGKKSQNIECYRSLMKRRACRGKLHDNILDWEHSLPENDLEMSDYHSSLADLNVCLGTTLQIVPSGNLPLRNKKYGGKIAVVNLQPTKHDKKIDLRINCYVDDVFIKVMKKLNLEIPEYSKEIDPTKNIIADYYPTWNISAELIKLTKAKYEELFRGFKKRKLENKKDCKKTKVKIKKEDDLTDAKQKIEELKEEQTPYNFEKPYNIEFKRDVSDIKVKVKTNEEIQRDSLVEIIISSGDESESDVIEIL